MNLVKELRARAFQGRFNLEAADEIERLTALVRQCKEGFDLIKRLQIMTEDFGSVYGAADKALTAIKEAGL
jgi:hypothetical protein